MGDIVFLEKRPCGAIDPSALKRPCRQLQAGLIQPALSAQAAPSLADHTAEPIKSVQDIDAISKYLIGQERYRDNMLFVVGINFGLRVSDLLKLTFNNIIDSNLCFRECFPILEQKTSKTRKKKRNRYITINDAVVEAVTLYLQHNTVKLDDYMFRGESNRSDKGKPMNRKSVDRILKAIAEECNIETKISTHSLRKTFGYHQMVMSGNDPRKLLLLQKIFGHSTSAQTLDYIGITTEEIQDAYLGLNLGGSNPYDRFCVASEDAVDTGMEAVH